MYIWSFFVLGCPVWRLIKTHDQGFRRSIMKRKLMTFQCIPSIIGDSIPMKEIVFITYVIVDGWTGIAGDIEPGHGLGATRLVTRQDFIFSMYGSAIFEQLETKTFSLSIYYIRADTYTQ